MTEHTPPAPSAIDGAVRAALGVVGANIDAFGAGYPGDTSTHGTYLPRPAAGDLPEGANYGWTTSFWPGMLWLAYELSGSDRFRAAGGRHVESFAQRIADGVGLDTHDLGFLYTLSCVAPWRLTGDTAARDVALQAADHLMRRVLEPAGIIQAWGDLADPDQRGRTIIDSLMNTPLLYWASEVTGSPHYAQAARRHASQLRDNILRPDDTTFHTFYWDPVTGAPRHGDTAQGHSDASCWARGQAWGIYGFALNYRYAGDESFRDAAIRCADYFLDHLPADHVAYWDLVFTDGSGQERDSSAAAIAASGLVELSGHLPAGALADRYRRAAGDILDSLVAGYTSTRVPGSNTLLLHGVYDKPKSVGVDEATLWGDYFYLEALLRRRRPDWRPYW